MLTWAWPVRVPITLSLPNVSTCGGPATVRFSAVDSSAVVSTIGTVWNQSLPLPGCRPIRANCALMYSTDFSSPGLPGPRPPNSSEARCCTCSAKSPASIASWNAWLPAAAASTAGLASPAWVSAAACWSPRGVQAHSASRARESVVARIAGLLVGCPAILAASPRSVLGRGRGVVRLRGGPAHAADAGGVMHVKHHVAFEHQCAVHHRARTDHDARDALLAPLHAIASRLLDADAALHMPAHADGDVTVHGLDAAAEIGIDQPDRAVHGGHVFAHIAAAIDEDAAVDGFDVAIDARLLAEADRAVHGRDRARSDVVRRLDAAIHGLHAACARAVFEVDATVDGAEVAVGLARAGGDAAVDLVDVAAGAVVVMGRDSARKGKQGNEEQGA